MMAKQKASSRSSSKAQVNRSSIPNLYWRSITIDQLRQQGRCIALAPTADEQQQQLGSPLCHRYVRQDTALWTLLHEGVLTTGRLRAALGMHEKAAAAVVGIHPGSRGYSYLLAAYQHLVGTTLDRISQGIGNPPTSSSAAAVANSAVPVDGVGSSSSSKADSLATGKHNKKKNNKRHRKATTVQQQQQQQHQQRQQQPPQLLPRPLLPRPPQQATAATAAALELLRQQYNERLAAEEAAAATAAAAAVIEETSADGLECAAAVEAAARQRSERAAAAGDAGVKMSWGKVQEAAALYCVLELFPEALLEEVGLFQVDTSLLPATWNVSQATLPPLGASPDAVLVHRLQLLPEDLQEAVQLLQQQSNVTHDVTSGAHDNTGTPAEAAAVRLLLQRGLERVVCAGVKSPTGVQLADDGSNSSSRESSSSSSSDNDDVAGNASIDSTQNKHLSSSSNNSGSLSYSSESSVKVAERTAAAAAAVASAQGYQDADEAAAACSTMSRGTAATGATSAAAVGSSSRANQGSAAGPLGLQEAGSLAFEPVAAAALAALHSWQQRQQQQQQLTQHTGATSSSGSSGDSSSGPAPPLRQQGEPISLVAREVVEVKNHCPFAVRYKRYGKKGGVQLSYGFSPRGCAGRVHPQWIPQLQMHMLATGCQTALLVSRCAERGVRVFRVWRDDEYLQDMLKMLEQLQIAHVSQQIPPPPDAFSRLPGHKAFLQRTVSLARGAACIAAGGEEVVARVLRNAVNQDKFWRTPVAA